jgi:DNA (cytosine-5)-methyltransferase 1
MRVCGIFSGIGGFELGLSRAGFQTVMMCENDPLARGVLERRFPDVPLRKDVRNLKSLPLCDVLTAGWPCQDLSQAGRTAGIAGEQSGLLAEVFRLLSECRKKPEFVLLENVAFALHLDRGAAIHYATRQLESLGYQWAYRILDSQRFGLPQRRRRIFIIGSLSNSPRGILHKGADCSESMTTTANQFGFYWTEGNRGLGWSPDAVPPLKGGSTISIPSPPAIWDSSNGSFFVPGIRDAERMQGFPSDWTKVGELHKKKSRARWKLVGNAVSVPVIEWIGRNILTWQSEKCVEIPTVALKSSPNAGFGGGLCEPKHFRISSEGPNDSKNGSLSNFYFLDEEPLSNRAASGFLSRIEKSMLRTHPRFIPDLRAFVN